MSNKEYYEKHRERIIDKQREYYWKDPERYRKYQRDYKKRNIEKIREKDRKYASSPAGIWSGLSRTKSRKISKDDFIKWYQGVDKICAYCGISEKKIEGTTFNCWNVNRLQIDRKDNNKPYQKGNLALACPLCNFVKGSYFTYEEMLELGKVIRKINKQKKPTRKSG